MNTLKIEVPEGYEIDTEKSTFEEIVFKPVKKRLPKSWDELETIDGFWVDICSEICEDEGFVCDENHKNVFNTKEQAKAAIALAQLSQLREVYRQGWVPDWHNSLETKYSIVLQYGKTSEVTNFSTSVFLSFQSAEIRDQFFANFKDLIEDASPLLFG